MMISLFPWEIVMLEKYYIRPTTIDRIHKSWIASAVEQYVSCGWQSVAIRIAAFLAGFSRYALRK